MLRPLIRGAEHDPPHWGNRGTATRRGDGWNTIDSVDGAEDNAVEEVLRVQGLRGIRVRWRRLVSGVDPGDERPGTERDHLRGRALRRAVQRGEVDPDGGSRTIRAPGPDESAD